MIWKNHKMSEFHPRLEVGSLCLSSSLFLSQKYTVLALLFTSNYAKKQQLRSKYIAAIPAVAIEKDIFLV